MPTDIVALVPHLFRDTFRKQSMSHWQSSGKTASVPRSRPNHVIGTGARTCEAFPSFSTYVSQLPHGASLPRNQALNR